MPRNKALCTRKDGVTTLRRCDRCALSKLRCSILGVVRNKRTHADSEALDLDSEIEEIPARAIKVTRAAKANPPAKPPSPMIVDAKPHLKIVSFFVSLLFVFRPFDSLLLF